jgi:hypothetical protein
MAGLSGKYFCLFSHVIFTITLSSSAVIIITLILQLSKERNRKARSSYKDIQLAYYRMLDLKTVPIFLASTILLCSLGSPASPTVTLHPKLPLIL